MTEEEIVEQMFFTNAYPADKDANACLIRTLKVMSLGIGAADGFIIYYIIRNLYEYVTTIHKEPDEVMMLCGLYGLGLVLKVMLSIYGYHFASVHTDRTPKNFKGLLSFFNIATFYTLISTVLTHRLLHHHVHHHIRIFDDLLLTNDP